MTRSESESYKKAGVDVTAGYNAVKLMRSDVEKTFTKGVIGSIGGFGGLFEPDFSGMSRPVLVSGADGVGTKLKIAFLMDKHDTVGIDCVAMCVNDILCSGARPLFFLDYIALGRLDPSKVQQIVSGVSEGCLQASCALIGGETAEMPGFYPENEYDLAGFAVGALDYNSVIDGKTVRPGDALVAVSSSGVHSNGFSLIRKALDINEKTVGRYEPELKKTLGEELLTPTRIYSNAVKALRSAVAVKALSHITGGGFYENIPRMLPEGICARIEKKAMPRSPIFDIIMRQGNIPERDMYNTFNMGAGLIAVVAPEDAAAAVLALNAAGERAHVIGECVRGEKGVELY
ncbi:MAG: phosphoribosylformylglycinamidine cyclo-ligase [Bacillota bacterium]|nr:phosphoribosylformylglycinamidine cyclo-ligase [Bacillota bacterium]